MTELIIIVVGAIFVNNFILARFLGICPFVGVSKNVEDSVGMGVAVMFVMVLASVACWAIYYYVLVPLGMEYMMTITFILVIAALVQFVESAIRKMAPALYRALGIYLPLITTNCAVLGIAILNVNEKYDLIRTIFHAVGASAGFTMALVIMAGIRERTYKCDVPPSIQGAPLAFILAGLIAIAFMGFAGMF